MLLSGALLAACGGDNTPSKVQSPGAPESAKTQVLEAGADVLQDKDPLENLDAYLDGFHFVSGDMRMQMEAHHYCGAHGVGARRSPARGLGGEAA